VTRSRILASAVLISFLLPALDASADRRRPARIIGVTLSGTVLDVADSSPIVGAVVRVQDRTFVADQQGAFVASGLAPGPATVVVERWGYEPLTQSVILQEGANTLSARLMSKPVIQITTAAGTQHSADFETAFFGTQGPLSPYIHLSPAEFCRADGSIALLEKEQISRITSSGTVVEGGPCCPTGGESVQIIVTPRDGQAFTAYAQECRFYRYDVVARDRATGNWLYLSFRQISDIRFP
jgi:hypothetical protein